MDIRLPRLGEGADSGTVSTIFVKEGDFVKKEQAILELESEKAIATIPSPAAGTVVRLHVKEGDEIKVGQLIVSLSENGAAAQPSPAAIEASVGKETEGQDIGAVSVPPSVENALPLPAFDGPRPGSVPPPASPTIRKLARELGLDLTRVRGSERGGRIVMADLKRYVQALQQAVTQQRTTPVGPGQPPAGPPPSVDFAKWGHVQKKKMTNLRRTISFEMVDSWTTIPHITQFDEADVTDILVLRKKYGSRYEKKGGHLTLTSFALQAVTAVLKRHPLFNASIDEAAGEIVFKEYYHIGIAVDTEQGLIVPVIRDVDKKDLLTLSTEINDLAGRTRERKVTLEEMQGGTFTISNQGGIGSGHFTPIINKPEVAILGMGRGTMKTVLHGGKSENRTILPVTLSYDHRIIDGAEAARFMVDLVQYLEGFKEANVKI